MREKEPRSESQLTPEQEARKQRYLASLENFQGADLEDLYPAEIKKRDWVEVTNEQEVSEQLNKMRFLKHELPPARYGLFRDKDGEHEYFVQRSKVQDVQLDLLATAREIAPWAKQTGILQEQANSAQEMWSTKCGSWSFTGSLVQSDPLVRENLVNGLGDAKYTPEQRHAFLRENVAAIVHENTHINNTDSWDFGGPARKISETAPMAAEYLAFPGKNKKMADEIDEAMKLLQNEQEEDDYYNGATLMGMLVMARDEDYLPKKETIEEIEAGLTRWQKGVENMSPDELVEYRRKVEEEWLLSNDDLKLHDKLRGLRKQYPNLMQRLIGDHQLKTKASA